MAEAEHSSTIGIMKGLDWVIKIAYLNLLWLFFTLCGGIILGMGPATTALFSLIRKKYLMGDISHIFSKYYHEWKSTFKSGNQLFIPLALFGLFLYVDFRLIEILPESSVITYIVIPALVVLSGLWIVISVFTFSFFSHYSDLTFRENVKKAFWFALLSPLESILLIIGVSLNSIIVLSIPATIPFFMFSPTVVLTQVLFFRRLNRMKSKEEVRKS
jgi:uncharacterized membrane protein YesL